MWTSVASFEKKILQPGTQFLIGRITYHTGTIFFIPKIHIPKFHQHLVHQTEYNFSRCRLFENIFDKKIGT